MGKNVLIPVTLVKQIIELLGYWDISEYDRVICEDYDYILQSLNIKLQKLELRDVYSKIITAGNQDDRHDARIEYLWQKSRINDAYADDHAT